MNCDGYDDDNDVVRRADYDCCSLTTVALFRSGLQLQQQRDKSERGRADRDIQRLRAKEFSPSKAASSGTGDGALEYGNFV